MFIPCVGKGHGYESQGICGATEAERPEQCQIPVCLVSEHKQHLSQSWGLRPPAERPGEEPAP